MPDSVFLPPPEPFISLSELFSAHEQSLLSKNEAGGKFQLSKFIYVYVLPEQQRKINEIKIEIFYFLKTSKNHLKQILYEIYPFRLK
jgi:hypothetical protein